MHDTTTIMQMEHLTSYDAPLIILIFLAIVAICYLIALWTDESKSTTKHKEEDKDNE